MKERKDIFDLSDITDISKKVELNLVGLRINKKTKKLLDLFNIKTSLSIDEILVALYRLYRIEETREWVSSTLYNLSRKNLVKKHKIIRGFYERTDKVSPIPCGRPASDVS